MALKDRTRRLFAYTIEDLARRKPIEKIQVKELCETAGCDRTVFYYYFRDKADLIVWMILDTLQGAVSLYREDETQPMITEEILRWTLENLTRKHIFYKEALTVGQVSVKVRQGLTQKLERMLEREWKQKNLSSSQRRRRQAKSESGNPESRMEYVFYASGFVGLLSEWIVAADPGDADRISKLLSEKYPI